MTCTYHYDSPLGGICLASDEAGITGLWFDGGKYFAANLPEKHEPGLTPAISSAVCWLDAYFSGRRPGFTPPLHLLGTDFQLRVWKKLLEIPYGETITYGSMAKELAAELGLERMSAQAVGGAVGHNAVSIIIPCHRVIGAGGSLTGYAGGIDRKLRLLELEGVDTGRFFVPKSSTAP